MNKILFDKEDSLMMNIVQKCVDKLPKWDDVARNIPFIVTGSVGLAFVFISRAERRKQQEREREYLNRKLKKDNISGENKSDIPIRQIEEEEEKKDTTNDNNNNNKNQNNNHHFQTEKTEDKTPSSNMQRFAKKNNSQTNKKNHHQQNDSGSGDENDSDLGAHKNNNNNLQNNNQNNNNAYMNNSEYEFFNSQRYSQNEEDDEERFDKVIANDQVSEVSSNHYMKSQGGHREKKQKRAPIKINRNFATDTENNEKFQKLKSIVQKEKKIEDKVFFQMFLNIVGTEADEDDDD